MKNTLFWAKKKKEPESFHSLLFHSIDVAACLQVLWNNSLSSQLENHCQQLLNLTSDEIRRTLAFLISLHDIGKASPSFQENSATTVDSLLKQGFPFPSNYTREPHGLVSYWSLKQIFVQENFDKRSANILALALGSHHGSFFTSIQIGSSQRLDNMGDEYGLWQKSREAIYLRLKNLFKPSSLKLPLSIEKMNSWIMLLAGLTTLSDWIGSIENYFPFCFEETAEEEYLERAVHQAKIAIHDLGWERYSQVRVKRSFQDIFPFIVNPNSMQQSVMKIAEEMDAPYLLIIEAPTGVGKTEAALFSAYQNLYLLKGKGFYVAMPTTATSNQMFDRVKAFLTECSPNVPLQALLVHGRTHVTLGDHYLNLNEENSINSIRWFLPKKRSLLSSFGVGTVDQSFLGILRNRHFYMRLFGLGHKVIIFDEVHAYDTYMNTIFLRLLRWLKFSNTTVIILSATLPNKIRHALIEAYSGETLKPDQACTYPRLTWVKGENIHSKPLSIEKHRQINIGWIWRDAKKILTIIQESIQFGGHIAVICNTVRRAQLIYQVISDASLVEEKDLILFHSRFPYTWRQEIEKDVLKLFGKESSDHCQKPIVLIATQVVEQSLDLDFDLIITDLAPVDLILQRIGRLHRHAGVERPQALREPKVWITEPEPTEFADIPNFKSDRFIYDESILLKSFYALKPLKSLTLPEDTSRIIEQVYGEVPIEYPSETIKVTITKAVEKFEQQIRKEELEAKKRLLPGPENEDLFLNSSAEVVEDEDPSVHQTLKALTRISDPNVSMICLEKRGDEIYSLGDPPCKVNLEKVPNREEILPMLQGEVSLSHPAVVQYVLKQGDFPAWRNTAELRFHHPFIFEHGQSTQIYGKTKLGLSKKLGITYFQEE